MINIYELIEDLKEHSKKAHETGLEDLEQIFTSSAYVIERLMEIISEESKQKFERGIDSVET